MKGCKEDRHFREAKERLSKLEMVPVKPCILLRTKFLQERQKHHFKFKDKVENQQL